MSLNFFELMKMMAQFARTYLLFIVVFASALLCANADDAKPKDATTKQPLPSLAEAKQQAAILHDAMHATLQIVHHQYYREDEGLRLPAATLKDVFKEIEETRGIKLRWLVVDGQAMNSDHEPTTEFDKLAVKALQAGEKRLEDSQHGILQHAGAITLTNHCLKCHVPDRKSTEDRTAGLIISIPYADADGSR